jgi:hypothetical protein
MEVSLRLVARETVRLAGSARGRDLALRFDEGQSDCSVVTDPYVLGPLLTLLVACADARGAGALVLRVRGEPRRAMFRIEPVRAADVALPTLTMRVTAYVGPTWAVAQRVAEHLGATVELKPEGGSLALVRSAGG